MPHKFRVCNFFPDTCVVLFLYLFCAILMFAYDSFCAVIHRPFLKYVPRYSISPFILADRNIAACSLSPLLSFVPIILTYVIIHEEIKLAYLTPRLPRVKYMEIAAEPKPPRAQLWTNSSFDLAFPCPPQTPKLLLST